MNYTEKQIRKDKRRRERKNQARRKTIEKAAPELLAVCKAQEKIDSTYYGAYYARKYEQNKARKKRQAIITQAERKS